MNFNDIAAEVHAVAVDRGWYDSPRNVPELIALMHSELSEALEDWREYEDSAIRWAHNVGAEPKPEGLAVEFADAIIRILDACAYLNLDIEEAIRVKIAFNRTRPYRHGGKRA